MLNASLGAPIQIPDRSVIDVGPAHEITRYQIKDGKATTSSSGAFYTAWENFYNGDKWEKIDTTIRQTANDFVMDKAPFKLSLPLRSTGTATFLNDNKWDFNANDKISAPPMTLNITAEGVFNVPGHIESGLIRGKKADYVIYPGAYPDGSDLIYYISRDKAPKLEKLVKINSVPSGDLFYSFIYQYDKDVDFTREVSGSKMKWQEQIPMGTKKAVGIKPKGETQKRGIGIRPPKAWDSADFPKTQDIQVDYAPLGNNSYKVTKIVPKAFFDGAVMPVFTDVTNMFVSEDADQGNLGDGRVNLGTNATWTNVRDVNDGSSADTGGTGTNCPNANQAGGSFEIIRCYYGFATGYGIGTGDTIDDLKFSVYSNTPGNGLNDGFDYWLLVEADPASDAAIATADADAITSVAGNNPFTDGEHFRDFSSVATGSGSWIDGTNIPTNARVEFQFNATGTANTAKSLTGGRGSDGFTFFALVEGHDYENSPLSGNPQNNFTSDFAGGANPPILFAEFSSSTPGGGASTVYFKPIMRRR